MLNRVIGDHRANTVWCDGGEREVLRIVFVCVRERERESSLPETFARTMAGSFVTSRANFCRSLFIKNVTRGAGTVVARTTTAPR